jgi:hypothetical protein
MMASLLVFSCCSKTVCGRLAISTLVLQMQYQDVEVVCSGKYSLIVGIPVLYLPRPLLRLTTHNGQTDSIPV